MLACSITAGKYDTTDSAVKTGTDLLSDTFNAAVCVVPTSIAWC